VDEELLAGGVANAGAVTRLGDHVLRPANPHSASIHRFLHALRSTGFEGASQPVAIDPDGRERLVFIEGAVALPPFPAWVQADEVLASAAALMRRFHDASGRIDATGMAWSAEMADPAGGPIICHNDVCLENVVFRDGQAIGLLDWEFVRRRVDAGDLNFIKMLQDLGGMERWHGTLRTQTSLVDEHHEKFSLAMH